MWVVNKDTGQWTITTDKLPTTDFQALEQDLISVRFYQK